MRRLPSLEAGLDKVRREGRPMVDMEKSEHSMTAGGWSAHVAEFFTTERFSVVRRLGEGVQGQAILVAERDEFGQLVRHVVVKAATRLGGDRGLSREAEWLTKLRGCPHICQIIATNMILWLNDEDYGDDDDDDDDYYEDEEDFTDDYMDPFYTPSPPKLYKRPTKGPVERPVVVMEFIPNGTLEDMAIRHLQEQRRWPTRVTWLILQCREWSLIP